MNRVYEKVVVMGSGSVAMRCLDVLERKGAPGLSLVEYRPAANLDGLAKGAAGPVQQTIFRKKADVERYFLGLTQRTLVASVNNIYIFPLSVCSKKNLQIVNCHSALLPKYPGIHAQTWAIYNNESESGITWHFVDAGIDSGDIITQAAVPISKNMTALALMRQCFNKAVEAFEEIAEPVLAGRAPRVPQEKDENRHVYGFREYPNEGVLDTDHLEHAYRILRSMDFGIARLLPPVTFHWRGDCFEVLGYRLGTEAEGYPLGFHVAPDGKSASINEGGSCLMLKIAPKTDSDIL